MLISIAISRAPLLDEMGMSCAVSPARFWHPVQRKRQVPHQSILMSRGSLLLFVGKAGTPPKYILPADCCSFFFQTDSSRRRTEVSLQEVWFSQRERHAELIRYSRIPRMAGRDRSVPPKYLEKDLQRLDRLLTRQQYEATP